MKVYTLINTVRAKGIMLWEENGQLKVKAPKGALTADIRDQIKTNRSAIIAFLSQASASKKGSPVLPARRKETDRVPLSLVQERLWVISKLNPENPGYNIPVALVVKEQLDVPLLNKAINTIIDRHEILRTVFPDKDGVPRQEVRDSLEIDLEMIDLSLAKSTAPNYTKAKELCQAEAARPFDMATGPLIRAKVIKLSAEAYILMLTMHHIISDDWSVNILLKELFSIIDALREGKPGALSAPMLQYLDYSIWQREAMEEGGELRRQLAYWEGKLSGVPEILDLATDYPRPGIQDFNGASQTFTISPSLTRSLKDLAEQYGCTLYMLLLAVFKVQLYRYTGQEDICIGSAIANRQPEETHELPGMFVNTLALRTQVADTDTFADVLGKVKTTCVAAYEHQDTPFEKIVELVQPRRNPAVNPLFQIMVSQNIPLRLSKENVVPFQLDRRGSKFDMTIEFTETENGLDGLIEYATALFKKGTIARTISNFMVLCEAVTVNPGARITKLDLLTAAEKQLLVTGLNQTGAAYPREKCFHQLFLEQVENGPERTALVFEDEQLTYRQLYEKSHTLALYLQSLEVKPDSLVGICVERSPDMLAGLLGIMQAGGAYLPLDPEYPDDRLAYMLEDSKASIVLTQGKLKKKVAALAEKNANIHLLALDQDWPLVEKRVRELTANKIELSETVRADHLAYVIYTSGSTGKPKGVMIAHGALVNFLCSMSVRPGIKKEDKLLAVTTYCFDIAGLEFYLPLLNGAQLRLCRSEDVKDATSLKNIIEEYRPTIMQATPATWQALFYAGWQNQEKLKILVGGEALPEALQKEFADTGSEAWNVYGPTETTIWSTVRKIGENETITIGSPIANTQVYIVDPFNNLQPLGVPGELHIAGDGLARGYLNRPELTRQKFVPNPFDPQKRMYKTGDMARWLDDHTIEYLGRIDTQVKIRGFRIETGEIKSHLDKHPQVKACAVLARGNGTNKKLVAFYVASGTKDNDLARISNHELKTHLQQFLPGYMVPSVFVSLGSLPMTSNGKINIRKLQEMDIDPDKSQEYIAPADNERRILDIWAQVLSVKPESIGVNDNFFDAGGNSISAVSLAANIEKATSCKFSPIDLFKYSTVHSISEYVREKVTPETPSFSSPSHQNDPEKLATGTDHPGYYDDSLAIVGISCHFPDAENHWQFWENLIGGRESVRLLPAGDKERQKVAPEILNNPDYVPLKTWMEGKEFFDPEFFQISSGNAALMDPQFRQLLMHSWKAVEDAGYHCRDIEKTSVFMAASNNLYQSLAAKLPAAHVMEQADEFVSWILAQGGTIPTMISYQLGLKGPSAFVHSNCSSSLTGLYYAYQSLQSGDADYALVGAATLSASLSLGYLRLPGMNFSGDGHCRTFDAGADGMVDGEGVGVVLVKRAKDAIRDGDHIYSLIRGISVNNDGADKAGFYAPGISGQTAVIADVLQKTGIHPESIGYVEAHGTGTALGDPIEVKAISEAYEKYTAKKQFCAIGSVKPNIGHLDTAAGLAGIIKLAMSLCYKKFPPVINYRYPNPQIDFGNSPFYVADKDVSWSKEQYPKRAALSSFGIGGTNTHAILEEYTPVEAATKTTAGAVIYAVPLSARGADRLKEYAQNLLSFLTAELPGPVKLSEIAFTLQTGRKAMQYRVVFTVKTIAELIAELGAFIENKKSDVRFEGVAGPGAERGRALEEDEDYRELITHWLAKRKVIKLAQLWAGGTSLDWKLLYDEPFPLRTSLPAYPFSKVRCWIDTVSSNAPRLHPLLHSNTSDFARQSYSSVFSGREFFLADHRLQGQHVFPAVAYLEMAYAAIMRAAPQTTPAVLELCDTVWVQPLAATGQTAVRTELSVNDGGQVGYEILSENAERGTVHCEGKAKFIDGPVIAKLDIEQIIAQMDSESLDPSAVYRAFDEMGTYYGPAHRAITGIRKGRHELLARLKLPDPVAATLGDYLLHPSLLDGALQAGNILFKDLDQGAEQDALPFALESLRAGAALTGNGYVWARLAPGSKPEDKLIKLDIDLCDQQGNVCVQMRGFSFRMLPAGRPEPAQETPAELQLAIPVWQPDPLAGSEKAGRPENSASPVFSQHYVILCDLPGIPAHQLEMSLPGAQCLQLEGKAGDLAVSFAETALACFEKIKAVFKDRPKGKVLIQLVTGNGPEQRVFAGLSGLFNTASLENPGFAGQVIQINERSDAGQLVQVLRENLITPAESPVSYIQGRRHLQRWEPVELARNEPGMIFKDKGVYLITGGLGGLGRLFTKEFLRQVSGGQIILSGRSELTTAKKEALNVLNAQGISVEYRRADISDAVQAVELISFIIDKYRQLNGILHCAGTISDNFILKKAPEEFSRVLDPKVRGACNLDKATRNIDLDFIALFSSDSALGSLGQADYAAANGFLDQFAAYRNQLVAAGQRRGRTVSINWPYWQDGGMQVDPATLEMLRKTGGLRPMPTRVGMQAFFHCLAMNQSQVLVSVQDGQAPEAELIPAAAEEAARPEPHLTAPAVSRVPEPGSLAEQTREYLKRQFSGLFKLPAHQIGSQTSFETYGIDSILTITITNQLEKTFGPLSKTLLFEYQTIDELTAYFTEAFGEKLIKLFGAPPGKETPADDDAPSNDDTPASDQAPANDGAPANNEAPVNTGKKRFFQDGLAGTRVPAVSLAAAGAPEPEPDPGKDDLIAIIGVSGRYPESPDIEAYWNNLRDGKDCITEVPKARWDWRDYYTQDRTKDGVHYSKWGGFIEGVDEFDPRFFNISPKEAEILDPQERLFLQHAWMAVEDAGYTRAGLQIPHKRNLPGQVGVYVGVMYSEYQLFGAEISQRGKRMGFANSMADVANRVSFVLNLHGPSFTLDTMCSSSLTSIHLACQDLKSGRTDMAIAGGVNVSIHPNKYLLLSSGQYISTTGHCHSFGEGGDGYIPGEGVGAVILKKLSAAEKSGDHIYGVIRGSALNHGGKPNGYTVPNPQAQADLISQALEDANTDPRHISYIEAHGTGTPLGDPIEIAALTKAFYRNRRGPGNKQASAAQSQERGFCMIGSVKSNIGHCESAAGVAGVTKILLQMKHRQIVPSLHSRVLNPNIDFEKTPFVVSQALSSWERPVIGGKKLPRIAGISSFGAGGANAHLILEEYLHESEVFEENTAVVVVLSARTAEQLKQKALDLVRFVRSAQKPINLLSMAYTLQVGREAMEERLGIIVRSADQLLEKLQAFTAAAKTGPGLPVEDIYQGQVKKNLESMLLISQDDDMRATIDRWIARKKIEKLLNLWVKGLDLDWQKLYVGIKPKRMSLPAYPFARERYWWNDAVKDGKLTLRQWVDKRAAAAAIHPLLHVNTSILGQQRYRTTFTGEESYLKAYSASGKKTLPAAAYLEMARAALEQALPDRERPVTLVLQNTVWGQPLIVSGGKQISISLLPTDREHLDFEVYSEDENEEIVHCQGHAVISRQIVPAKLDIAQIETQAGKDELLIAIDVPGTGAGSDPDAYFIHPDVLDKALAGAGSFLFPADSSSSFPAAVASATVISTCRENMLAWLRYAPGVRPGDQDIKLDLDICDTRGNISLQLRGISYLREPAASDGQESRMPEQGSPGKHFGLSRVIRNVPFLDRSQIARPGRQITGLAPLSSTPAPLRKPSGLVLPAPGALPSENNSAAPARLRIMLTEAVSASPEAAAIFPDAAATSVEGAVSTVKDDATMQADFVELQEHGEGVFSIRVNNASLSKAVAGQLLQALNAVRQLTSVKVVLIRGGETDFMYGGRLQYNDAAETGLYQAISTFPYPVLAVMEGNAGGAGFLLGALCDFMICNEQAAYSYTDPQGGLFPSATENKLFEERFGIARAADFLYRSAKVTGKELREKGWSVPILPKYQMEPYLEKLVLSLARKPQRSLCLLKQHLARRIGSLAAELKAVRPVSPENDRVPAASEIDKGAPAFKNIDLHLEAGQVLLIHIRAGGNGYSSHDCLKELAAIFKWMQRSGRSRSVVIRSDYPELLPLSGKEDAEAIVSGFADLILQSEIPVIAVSDIDSTGLAWLLSQFCDACVYNKTASYSIAGLRQVPSLVRMAATLFSYRLGNAAAREILLSGKDYTGLELQERIPALPVAGKDQALSVALKMAALRASWPLAVLVSMKQHSAAAIRNAGATREKIIDLPPEAADEAFKPVNPASGQVPLRSKVIHATAGPDGVILVKMEDREEKNMFSDALTQGIIEVFEHIKQTPAYKVVILTGFDNYFASGGTKEDLLAIQEGKTRFTDTKFYHLAMECPVPVISAMQGHAIGAGWSYGMFADFTIFSEESKYLSPYMNFGFTPGAGATFILPEKMGYDLSRETLLSGLEIGGSELRGRGLSLPVVSRPEVLPAALRLAKQIAGNTRRQLIAIKDQLTKTLHARLEESYQLELNMHNETFVGQEETRAEIQRYFNSVNGNDKGAGIPGHPVAGAASPEAIPVKDIPAKEISVEVASAEASPAALEELTVQLKKYLAQELHMDEAEIDAEAQFIDLGLDSITGVTWVRKINEKYDLSIEATKVYSYPTLNEFGEYIRNQLEKRGIAITSPVEPAGKTNATVPGDIKAVSTVSFTKKLTSWRKKSGSGNIAVPAAVSQTGPVAIIGMAGQFPQARNLEEFWANISQGKNCITKVPEDRWDLKTYFSEGDPVPGKTNCQWQGSLEDYDRFDPLFFNISPAEAADIDPQQRLFLQTCWHTIENAGYDAKTLSGSQCGVFAGAAIGDYQFLSRDLQLTAKGFTGTANSILAARISYFLNLQGPCLTIDTACSSSLVAIASACDSLISGNSDLALAGGVCVMAGPDLHVKSSQAGMLSQDGRCYTFDERANGFVPGEGVGVVMLKRLADAEKDQDRILGVIRGWGVNQDGKTNGITAPNPESQKRLIRNVYDKFHIDPARIQLIEAHGTGTKLGDPIEVAALKESFRNYTTKTGYCAIGSVKSNIGHCMAAAGVASAIKVAMALHIRQLPPTINFERLNQHINLADTPFYVNDRLRHFEELNSGEYCAAVSSFGFSGTNAHLVISGYRAERSPQKAVPRNPGTIIPLSARNAERLNEKVRGILDFIRKYPATDLYQMAYTLQTGREAMEDRLGFLVRDTAQLTDKLQAWADGQKAIEGVFRAQVNRGNEGMQFISQDRDVQETLIDKWISGNQLAKLVKAWVNGLHFDWNKLYGTIKPQRIDLPLYPFAKERYWIEDARGRTGPSVAGSVTVSAAAPAVIHPLLHTNTSNFSQQSYSTLFSGQEFFLKDHLVQIDGEQSPPKKVLPGVVYLEMARAAIENAMSFAPGPAGLELRNIVWVQPIVVSEKKQVEIALLANDDTRVDFEIYDFDSGRKVLCCQGQGVIKDLGIPPRVAIDRLHREMDRGHLDADRAYAMLKQMGLDYGPAHRAITIIDQGEKQALALLRKPEIIEKDHNDPAFILNPGMVDSAIQAATGIIEDGNQRPGQPALPFALESLQLFSGCKETMYSWVRHSPGNKPGGKLSKLDIDLMDQDGTVCLQLRGLTSRIVNGETRQQHSGRNGSDLSFDDSFYKTLITNILDKKVSVDEAANLG